MNREQKAAVVEEVAAQIREAEAVFAVDFRGMSVPQAAELRSRLGEAGARFRVVKNTLTLRAADKAGASELKDALEGPTALTFVVGEGADVALAARALAQFRRQVEGLQFKGGRLGGDALSGDQIEAISRLPAREALNAQLVGIVASPLTGLVRSLGALIGGLAVQLNQIAEQGLVSGEPPAQAEGAAEPGPPAAEPEAGAPEQSAADDASEAAAEAASAEPAPAADGGTTSDTDDAPAEGDAQQNEEG